MIIEAHLLCWNEIDIMPFVIRHYKQFCDRIVIHDNHSTDGSAELAASLGCEVIPFGNRWFDDQENMNVKNNCWKGSKADWVIVADFDEVLWYQPFTITHPVQGEMSFDIKDFLLNAARKKHTIIRTYGWQIMSEEMPQYDLLESTNGYHFENYSKSIIFNPKDIKEINYNPGAHKCNPTGNVVWSTEELFVLHYKHIGGLQRTIERYKLYNKRMSKANRQKGWGVHYNQSPAQLRKEWNERMAKSKPLL